MTPDIAGDSGGDSTPGSEDESRPVVYDLAPDCTAEDVEVGANYHAVVNGVVKYGVFVDISDEVSGLVHESNLDRSYEVDDRLTVTLEEIRENGDLAFDVFRASTYRTVVVDHEPEITPIEDLDVGDDVHVEGQVAQIKQTGGPTVFRVADETGIASATAFREAGVRAFPAVDLDDVVRLGGSVESHEGALQIEVDSMVRLEGDDATKARQRLDAAFEERAEPAAVEPLAEWPAFEKLREDLNREVLETKLTSLTAFDEEGYLARDLSDRIENRIGQCYAWDSTLMSWNDEVDDQIGDIPSAVRDIWMLHSDENANLPDFDITGAGVHDFRSSGDEDDDIFPSFEDPYTVQFLSYTLDSPLTDLQIYTELERAAEEDWLDAIVDVWDDYRLAFAYPEWYGREIQRVFDIETSTELPKPPELDETKITVNKEDGEFKSWISSHGLASYLWGGDEWDGYNGYITVDGYDRVGWKHYLIVEYGLTYDDMRSVVPNGRTAELWHAGEITWEELLEEVQENLIEQHNIEIELTKG